MLNNIPLIILLEKCINFTIHLIHTWFDLLFPYLVFNDNTDNYSILTRYSYDNSIFSYGYYYNNDSKNHLIPVGFYICKVKDTYYMINNKVGKKNECTIRHLIPFNRSFIKLLDDINKISKNKEIMSVYSINTYGNIYLLTTVINPNKYINKYMINQIKDIYYKETGPSMQNKNAAFLLYGEPGSGKSTNISALSYLLNKDIFYITMDSIKPQNMDLLYQKQNVILLFEDWFPYFIDEYFNNKKTYKTERDFSIFLNLISGIASTKNCIFIFTCNSTKEIFNEKQIYPLFRPGRINHIFNVERKSVKYQQPIVKNNMLSFN
jgi:GTPase SAR1 family protein